MNETEITYCCSHCESDVELVVCINGPDEYFPSDETCPNCGSMIEGEDSDRLASEAVINYYAMLGDFAYDAAKDIEMGLWGVPIRILPP